MSKSKTTINVRFLDLIVAKKNQTLKKVLTTIEDECKEYKIDSKFFDQDDTKKGYAKIRKILLDNFNDITRYIEIVLGEVEIEPIKAVIKFSQEVIDGDKDNKNYPKAG